jgi:hypothetical protein
MRLLDQRELRVGWHDEPHHHHHHSMFMPGVSKEG